MKNPITNLLRFAISTLFLFQLNLVKAQKVVSLGNGSYTTQYPGADAAGRNGYPSGSPQLSKAAIGKPVPTNDWWSKLILNDHAGNLFNYPITMRTDNQGLIVTYIPWGVIGDSAPIEIGVTGLNASKANISDYSDWTVTMDWQNSTHNFQATSGIGMPFLYFEKASQDEARIKVNGGNASISGELLLVEDASAGADFVFYAPTGSTWTKSGSVYTSSLNGKNYWSMAMLPQNTSNASAVAQEYKQYAYVFPTDTTVDWSYNPATGIVQTDFEVTTETKEGSQTQILQGLLPHQWSNLSASSPTPNKATYTSVRGDLKMLAGNNFQVENTYKGILPTLPYLANYSDGFSPASMNSKISQIENDALATWTDSYNEGQVMNRLVQTARIADQVGNVEARDKMIATVKERLEDWLTYQSGEVAFLFYYNNDWSAMLGYPAGHGQDNNINDHHFHWGYFIHAAAFMEQFEPGWADQWGPMINYLVRDAASDNRNDDKFPFLRNFSPFAGHSWANGFASFPQGNDQESTSESMQFNSSLIHWGTITGNDDIRDLGVYLYTTEQTAIEEYWLDVYERNFKDGQQYSLVSRVWGNSYDNGTFWTSDITASYGIEMYPMHAGSLYLGHNKPYVQKLWNEIESNTGILSAGDTNPNLWHDTFWKYLSFVNPEKAIELYDAYPNRVLKFGVSDAQTYHWLHAMNAMGTIDATVTADYPVAAVFEKEGQKTYVAHNYNANPITVRFSDGAELEVPARQMATNKDVDVSGTLTSDFDQAYIAGSVNLTVSSLEGAVSKVIFYDGNTLLGEDNAAPFTWKATNLSLGNHGMYARVYAGADFNITNSVTIQVGGQVPYSGSPFVIPGTLEAGHYDVFEGGSGQGVSYIDLSPNNEGGFRPEESVDASLYSNEGATLGWLSAGEWVEYTIEVQDAGVYSVSFRCASGNPSGGGPFYFEIDGQKVSPNTSVPSTSTTDWDVWTTRTLNNLELNKGSHVLRLVFLNGEFNLGKMTFARTGNLSYAPPVADAGDNISVLLTEATATLDGSASADPEGQPLTYQWEQQYGPTSVTFDQTSATPVLSNLEEGVYNFELTVSDGTYTARDAVKILVSETGNAAPSVSITAPTNPTSYVAGTRINIEATAADLDGNVTLVEFFDGATKLGEDATAPYTYAWNNASLGTHVLTAKATDNLGTTSVSEAVNVSVDPLLLCTETGTQSLEGSFSEGYKATFETIGTSVKITFELLDNKSGVIAYLFRKDPFSEKQMTEVASRTFSETVSGLSTGQTISYACKFAFAGGLAVTRYIDYVVGQDCEDEDTDDNTDEDTDDGDDTGDDNEPVTGSITGTWKIAPIAGALGVGPTQGDISWWSNTEGDVATRACFFDDTFVFGTDGSFANVMGESTWIEGWQGGDDGCGTPVYPHNGAATDYTYVHDANAGTITLNGVGAHLGVSKVYNEGEMTSVSEAAGIESITYTIVKMEATRMTVEIQFEAGGGYWTYVLQKSESDNGGGTDDGDDTGGGTDDGDDTGEDNEPVTGSITGTWKIEPIAGALGVGPTQGDISWWSNTEGDVATRACFFDDTFVFGTDGSFANVMGESTWIEGWQGGDDGCGTPVYPHNGAATDYTYVHDANAGTITLNGVGAHLGVSKVYNEGEMTSVSEAAGIESITYTIVKMEATRMTVEIQFQAGGGYWTYMLQKSEPNLSVKNPDFNAIEMYPNPVTSTLHINSYTIELTKVEIFSLLGKKVKTVTSGFDSIHVGELSKGVYFINVSSGKKLLTKKMIKR